MICFLYSSSIQTLTVGTGVSPVQFRLLGSSGLYRRSGIAPCPEEVIFCKNDTAKL